MNRIEKMAKAGLGDDVIVSMIQSQPGHYDVTPDTLVSAKCRTFRQSPRSNGR